MSVTSELQTTRESLHRLAEHVLAAGRYQQVGRIGLTVVDGGIATPPFGEDGRTLGIERGALVLRVGAKRQTAPVSTLRAAGEFVGIEPGAPANVYHPATPCDLDAPLALDDQALKQLTDWYSLAFTALTRFVTEIADDEPSGITLWPEHMDVAIRAADINYGASPGDTEIPEPYLYVGPNPPLPTTGDGFWNASFGAALRWDEVHSVEDALAFLHRGRSYARA
jgi:hypothetical protein